VTGQGWREADGKRIDYFMVSMNDLRVNSYDVLSETHDGVYSSDHNPIVMTAVLE
jgi:exonuclease III